jgi:hypothetical protein
MTWANVLLGHEVSVNKSGGWGSYDSGIHGCKQTCGQCIAEKTKFLLIIEGKDQKVARSENKGWQLPSEWITKWKSNILGVTVNNKLKWQEQHRNIVNTLREYKQPIL